MQSIPTWQELSSARRVWEAAGGAVVWGAVCGLLLTVSAPLYVVGTVVGILGGIAGGAQHRDVRGALVRATAGGLLFGLAILAGYELAGGGEAKVELPEPHVALLLVTLLPAYPLHLLGRRLRLRADARTA